MTGKMKSYYSYDKIYSYNAILNFLCGARGLGKTYGAKKKAIKDAIKKGDQFIYLRRYKGELIVARNTFFADIAGVFPDYDFRTMGNQAQMAPIGTRDEKKREWATIGYFISLSTAQGQKSVSFPKVKTIIFDEFIIEKGAIHYLPAEATVFLNFYNTVDRYKDTTRVFFLANAVTINNPYFMEYKIIPENDNEIIVKFDGFILAHFPDSNDFQSEVYETRFGKFIADSEYADYAVGNTFEDNHQNLVALKNSNAKYYYTLETKSGKFAIWYDIFADKYYAQRKRPKGNESVFTLMPEKMSEEKVLLTFSDKPIANLRSAYRNAKIAFDDPSTRNAFIEVFKR